MRWDIGSQEYFRGKVQLLGHRGLWTRLVQGKNIRLVPVTGLGAWPRLVPVQGTVQAVGRVVSQYFIGEVGDN